MRNASPKAGKKGVSLVEAIIAVGVLAVAVPLVFATMAGSGDSGLSAQAETRCSWIVPACMEELELAMQAKSQNLPALQPSKAFPGGDPLALAFGAEGEILGKVDQGSYKRGLRNVGNKTARYIASMSGTLPEQTSQAVARPLEVKIIVEYPAAAPEEKRRKIEFHTKLP